jgi:hypothetical protein
MVRHGSRRGIARQFPPSPRQTPRRSMMHTVILFIGASCVVIAIDKYESLLRNTIEQVVIQVLEAVPNDGEVAQADPRPADISDIMFYIDARCVRR